MSTENPPLWGFGYRHTEPAINMSALWGIMIFVNPTLRSKNAAPLGLWSLGQMLGLGRCSKTYRPAGAKYLPFSCLKSWKSLLLKILIQTTKKLKPTQPPSVPSPSIIAGDLPTKPIFSTRTQKSGDPCEFFHKKTLDRCFNPLYYRASLILRGEIVGTIWSGLTEVGST